MTAGGPAAPGPGAEGGGHSERVDPRSCLTRVRRHLVRRLALAGVLWAGVLLGVVFLVAWLAAGGEGWTQGTWVPLALHLAAAGGAVGGGVAAFRWARRRLSLESLAGGAGQAVGLPRGTVLVGVELAGSAPPGASPALAREAADRVGRELARYEPAVLAGSLGDRLRGAIRVGGVALAAVALPLLAGALLTPERTGPAWAGILQPYGLVAEPVYPPLAVTPGDARVDRGDDVKVTVTAVGRTSVVLRRQEEGEAAVTDTLPVADGTASTVLEGVDAPITYAAMAGGGAETETYRLEPVDPLMLSSVRLELTFPEHTDLPPEEYHEVPGELVVPEGTHVALEGRANRPLRALELRPPEEAASADGPSPSGAVELQVDGREFSGSWEPDVSGPWRWRTEGGGAETAAGFPDLDVEVVPDAPPTVAILSPEPQAELPLSFRAPLEVEALDDYGVERVELLAWPVDASGEVGEERRHAMDAGGNREARLSPVLDVSGWGLRPGDEVRYVARAVDNAPEPGVGESEEHVLRLPGETELRRESRETLAGAASRLEELGNRAQEAAAQARDVERRSRRASEERGSPFGVPETTDSQDGGFQEEEAARQAMEEREELVEEVQELRAELEELAQGLRDAGLLDADLQRDLRELGGLLEELAPEEAVEEMEEWRRRLDEEGADARRDVLEELGDSQEALRDRLEESLERFRRAAAEEDFRALSQEGRELVREEEELAERFADAADDEELAQEADAQEGLEERAEELERRAQELADRLEAMAELEAAEGAREAQERFQEAQEAMGDAADRAREADGDGASEDAGDAAQALEEGLQDLEDSHEEMREEWAEALEEALQEVAGSALALARLQDGIGESLEDGRQGPAHVLRREEAAVLDGARSLARSARQVAAMDPERAGRLAEALGEAMEAMEETARALGGVGPLRPPTPSSVARASSERAVHGLNRVALRAMEGEGSGGEGGADAMAEALEMLDQLAEQQGGLAEEAGDLMEMGADADGFEDGAQELGRQQDQVAQGLHELGRRPGFDDSRLGDLEALEEEARELARQLEEGRLEPEVRQRQEELFRRLLDAGRGIDQQGRGEQREGTPADEDAFERPEVAPLDADALNPLRFSVPTGAQLERLPPAQRRLVVEYFQRLNRGGDEGWEPPEGDR